jgi:hypothetical protein
METVDVLEPAAPKVKRGNKRAANSRAVIPDFTCDQYVIQQWLSWIVPHVPTHRNFLAIRNAAAR